MTPDDIRSAIASNPQSQDTRVYLIRQAVENDMADEVPDEWTVDLYNSESEDTGDELDLIADEYKFMDPRSGQNIVIGAHESGALSIRIAPSVEPLVKFDLDSADRLINMFSEVGNWLVYHSKGSEPPQEIDPVTGISVLYFEDEPSEVEFGTFYLSIPGEGQQGYDFNINNTWRTWHTGLTTMANASETYGRQEAVQ